MVDVDKFHRNGPKDGDNQDIIIRFKSHSAKEEFYAKRKTIPSSSRIKVQPSLSPETKKLLSASSDYVDDFKSYNEVAEGEKKMKNCPDFTFADVHGNLLVKFSERTADGMFFRYNSMQQLSLLIQKYNEREDAENEFEKTMEPDYMWNGTNWVFTLKP